MTPALYVYGIVDADALKAPPQATGVDPAHALALLRVGSLTAIVSEVDVSEFEGDALERNASQPEWLEAKVRGHESVLDQIVATTTVVPMRFGSIFSSEAGLQAMLTEHETALKESLDRVRDRAEWGVKVYCDQRALSEQLAGPADEPRSGRDYLMQKSAELRLQTEAAEAASAVASQVHDALTGMAVDATTMAVRGGDPASVVVLNGAYLVDDDLRGSFMERVEELQTEHAGVYIFEVTGPWPPYNFTRADVSGPSS